MNDEVNQELAERNYLKSVIQPRPLPNRLRSEV